MPAPSAALRALMTGVIDYAGLFPPASLSLEDSIRSYARYLKDPDRWMLGRFICPAARLGELAPFVAELFASGEALALAALGRGGADSGEFESNLQADIAAIAAFRSEARGRAVVNVLETRIAQPNPASAQRLARRCEDAALRPFAEISSADDPSAINSIAVALASAGVGYKLRTGGVEAAAFASSEQLALAIVACRDAGAAMKFTAGLHHPIRHHNEGVKTKMHGFVNVFAACALARARAFDQQQICRVLDSEDPCDFRFRDYGLLFGDVAASTEQIAAARRDFAISFGSCSFDEPRDDLRALALL